MKTVGIVFGLLLACLLVLPQCEAKHRYKTSRKAVTVTCRGGVCSTTARTVSVQQTKTFSPTTKSCRGGCCGPTCQ